jgi:hypothetical protein
MNRKPAAPCLALALAAALTSLGLAEMSGGSGSGAATGNPTSNQINSPMGITNSIVTGTVQLVDRTSNTLEIRDTAGSLHRITLDNNTQVTRHGSSVAPSDIRAGDAIVIRTNNAAM